MSVNTKVNGELVKSAGLYSVTKPIGMADCYSMDEKEIGVWTNGKPLYQKTVYISALPSSAGVGTYSTGITGVESCWIEGGFLHSGDLDVINFDSSAYASFRDASIFFRSVIVDSEIIIYQYVGRDRSSLDAYVTVRYTKTADTPWSGFVPQGYGYVSSGDIYSFEERQVGVFADGKPLYQKTIDFGALPNNATKDVAHGISNIDEIISYSGLAYSSTLGYYLSLPYLHNSDATKYVEIYFSRTNASIVTKSDRTSYDNCYLTVQYTKTTDVAGSGEYVPSGDKAVHYSTDEQVIGTWIDGSTLYRKVFEIPISNKNTDYDITSMNVDKMVNLYGATATKHLPLNAVHSTGALPYSIGVNYSSNSIQIRFGEQVNIETPVYIVCEYTKSS